eukprot:8732497-Karenia_brevis.AAC.1
MQGARVTFVGLAKRQSLNGTTGTVVQDVSTPADDRVAVKSDATQESLRVKPDNLMVYMPPRFTF